VTTDERGLLEAVLTKVQETHDALIRHIAKCEACRATVDSLKVTVYGAEADDHRPGLKAQVVSLGTVMKVCFAVCGVGLLVLAVADTVLIVRALAW
jgi:hypothetical protein